MPRYRTLNGSLQEFSTPVDKPIALLIRVKGEIIDGTTSTIVQQKQPGESLEDFIDYVENTLTESGLVALSYHIVPPVDAKEFQ